jgi:single-strand DNA-binding protein
MGLEIKGLVHRIGATEKVSEKFSKREIVLHIASEYPQYIPMQLTQAKCSIADNLKVGEEINCHLNIKGREWTSPTGEVKYFATLEAWRIETQSTTNGLDNPVVGAATNDLPF